MTADDASAANNSPKRTPLHDLHIRLTARMTPFAGYDMPLQYADGILKEHLHTRAAAGLFDVSHMGQIVVRSKSGNPGDAAMALEKLVPVNVADLQKGRARYAFFTNDEGGIEDDLIIANHGDRFLLIVNAACKGQDERLLRSGLADICSIDVLDRALIALQGPKAAAALETLASECADLNFLDICNATLLDAACFIARSGYTGEDGFEISAPPEHAIRIAETLLQTGDVKPVGLGARDSLRLEAGLPLYGADLNSETTPVEAGLAWAIPKVRREGGARAGGFPGADIILYQLQNGPDHCRVGLSPEGRQPVRTGAELYETVDASNPIGRVTSGGFGPSVSAPVAMGYVPVEYAKPGTQIFASVRGKRIPAYIAALPFTAHRYKRASATRT